MDSSGKRKRADEGETRRQRSAEHREGDQTTATDDEVEEFFAILRRMHVAAKHLKRSYRNPGDPAGKRWNMPGFQADDLGEEDGGKAAEEKVEEVVAVAEEEKLGLDLNSAPPPCPDDLIL